MAAGVGARPEYMSEREWMDGRATSEGTSYRALALWEGGVESYPGGEYKNSLKNVTTG